MNTRNEVSENDLTRHVEFHGPRWKVIGRAYDKVNQLRRQGFTIDSMEEATEKTLSEIKEGVVNSSADKNQIITITIKYSKVPPFFYD